MALRLDLLVCEGCGRAFACEDGPAMSRALTGGCVCGGRFTLDPAVATGAEQSGPPEQPSWHAA
jgi:hypothetical protein